MTELIPWVNIVVVPLLIYVMKIKKRLTRIETILEIKNNKKRGKE